MSIKLPEPISKKTKPEIIVDRINLGLNALNVSVDSIKFDETKCKCEPGYMFQSRAACNYCSTFHGLAAAKKYIQDLNPQIDWSDFN